MTNSEKKSSVSQIVKIPDSNDNFGLTKNEFSRFVERVKNGDESLFVRVFNVQFKSSVRYIQNKFSITKEEAYDTCMDTLIEFRSKLKMGKIKYGNMRYLFTKMAINRYLDDIRKKNKIKRAIEIFVGNDSGITISEKEFAMLLNKSVDMLEASQKHMIKEIFFSGKDNEQIMKDNEISNATYRKRKERSLKKLKTIFLEQLKISQLL